MFLLFKKFSKKYKKPACTCKYEFWFIIDFFYLLLFYNFHIKIKMIKIFLNFFICYIFIIFISQLK